MKEGKKSNFEANDRNETWTKNEENKSENMCAIATASRNQMDKKTDTKAKGFEALLSLSLLLQILFLNVFR